MAGLLLGCHAWDSPTGIVRSASTTYRTLTATPSRWTPNSTPKPLPPTGGGNDTGWEVGVEYDPSNFAAPIYVAYEYIDTESGEKSSDFVQIDEPFTVIDATDSAGNEVTNVANEKRITQTVDVAKLEEELAQLRDEQQRLQQQSQAGGGGGGGGGGFLDGGNSTLLAALAAVARWRRCSVRRD